MFIVKKKSEIVRFGVFVALMGAMAYFVATRVGEWRTSSAPMPGKTTVTSSRGQVVRPTVQGVQATSLMDMVQARTTGEDFFATYRMQRDQERDTLKESLGQLLNNPNADADVKKQASAQLMEASRLTDLESRSETMLKAKGFEDALVSVTSGSAYVVVKAKALDQAQSLQVLDIVKQMTKLSPSAITVMAREK